MSLPCLDYNTTQLERRTDSAEKGSMSLCMPRPEFATVPSVFFAFLVALQVNSNRRLEITLGKCWLLPNY